MFGCYPWGMKKPSLMLIPLFTVIALIANFALVPLLSEEKGIDEMVVPIVDDHMPHTAEKPFKK